MEYEDTATVLDGELLEQDEEGGDLGYNSRPHNRKDYKLVLKHGGKSLNH